MLVGLALLFNAESHLELRCTRTPQGGAFENLDLNSLARAIWCGYWSDCGT